MSTSREDSDLAATRWRVRPVMPAVEARQEREHGRRFWLLLLACWLAIGLATLAAVTGGA